MRPLRVQYRCRLRYGLRGGAEAVPATCLGNYPYFIYMNENKSLVELVDEVEPAGVETDGHEHADNCGG